MKIKKLYFQLRCSAMARHDVIGSSTHDMESPVFFLGVTSHSPSQLTVTEGGPPVPIEFSSTIPITCFGSSSVNSKPCCIDLQVGNITRKNIILIRI